MRFLVLLNLLLALACSPLASARTLEQIRADGKIIFGTEGTYPPFSYFDGAKLTGFEIELGDAIAKKMGLRTQWKTMAFDSLLAGLRQDRFDSVLSSVGITPERASAVTFAQPHYCSGGVIVSTDPAIRSVATLAGKTVAVQSGTTYFQKVQKIAGIKEIKNYPHDTDAHAALINHRVDVWVTDRFVVKKVLQTNPNGGLKVGDYLFIEKIAAAFAKDNAALAAAYNQALASLLADGTYKALSEKYLKEDIRCK